MKTLTCDQCESSEKDVKTYTYNDECLNLKVDNPFLYMTSSRPIYITPQKEFCDDCAGIIQKSYKHFLETYVP